MFFGRNDAEAETPVLWPPHAKSWLTGKDSDAGKDWGQEEKVTTEDEMAGWHHRLIGREFEWTLGVGDGQGGLACCTSWGHKESDTTEWLNWKKCLIGLFHVRMQTSKLTENCIPGSLKLEELRYLDQFCAIKFSVILGSYFICSVQHWKRQWQPTPVPLPGKSYG